MANYSAYVRRNRKNVELERKEVHICTSLHIEHSTLIQPMRFFSLIRLHIKDLIQNVIMGPKCNRETWKFNESLNMHYSIARKKIILRTS